jgi:outer membrane protein W
MKQFPFIIGALFLSANILFSQNSQILRLSEKYYSEENLTLNAKKEPVNNWSINVLFSDNGFAAGSQIFKQFSPDVSGFAGIFFSGAKDDREFEVYDIFGNSYVPYKINRMFMIPINLGIQFRMFRDDVTDDLRPHINFGISPTAIIYTPYDESFFSSFGHARAKYTVGVFASAGLDYLTSKRSSLNMDVRYYYTMLPGKGIESLQDKEKRYFGGLYLVFSYNFMH